MTINCFFSTHQLSNDMFLCVRINGFDRCIVYPLLKLLDSFHARARHTHDGRDPRVPGLIVEFSDFLFVEFLHLVSLLEWDLVQVGAHDYNGRVWGPCLQMNIITCTYKHLILHILLYNSMCIKKK